MQYRFELVNPDNIYDAAAFVQRHEYCCVNLAEQLRLCLFPEYTPRYKKAAVIYEYASGQKICRGVIMFTVSGMLLHCFDPVLPPDVPAAFGKFFFCGGFPYKELHAVSGTQAETLILEGLMSGISRTSRAASFDYHLLSLTKPCSAVFFDAVKKNTSVHIRIARAGVQDAEALFSLQLAYENAEVAYSGNPINPAVCRLALQNRLKQEYIYAVWLDRKLAAKAGTNAQGFHWFQLGGIYTLPEYRRKGLAAAAVAHLVNTHAAQVHGFSLFVKIENTAAIRLYTKLGFVPSGSFRMSYR